MFAFVCSALSAQPSPLISWNFNEGGGDFAPNLGTGGEANLFLKAANSGLIPFSADAQGPSGKSGDYAFDLGEATGMGATDPASVGPSGIVWSNQEGLKSLSGLSSFTLTGWFKPGETINHAARIIVTKPFMLMAGTPDRLTLVVNDTNGSEQSLPYYQEINHWMFFAVTYDGTKSADNVTYYIGTTVENSLTQAGVTTLAAGKLQPFTGQVVIGNNANGGARPFKGMMDNLAIYGSAEGSAGALDLTALESVHASGLR